MLAGLIDAAPAGEQWLHEIKFDGYRILARIEGGRCRLFSRHGKDWTGEFPAIAAACAALPLQTAWLDGEVVALDAHGVSRFHDLQRALSDGRTGGLFHHLFDILHLDGWDLAGAPLAERKRVLKGLLAGAGDPLRYTDHLEGGGPAFHRQACAFALEGVVSKRADSRYRPGRSKAWVKVKCTRRQEFVVIGFTRPQASRTGIGALLLAVNEAGRLVASGRVGTGFSAADAAALERRLLPLARKDAPVAAKADPSVTWVEPALVAEVEFAEWTADGQLRHPSFQGLRLDRDPSEVVREGPMPEKNDVEDRVDAYPLTHPDRVLWPEQGLTKRALAALTLEISRWMLPHVAGRPLTLLRCPEGQGATCFYQRHPAPGMGKAVRHVPVGDEVLIAVDDEAGLVALVQAGALEIHTWGSRTADIEHPDLLVFDLDPDEGLAWSRVQEAALDLRQRLSRLGLTSFAKTTGGKGLHVVVPIVPGPDWERAKAFTRGVAEAMAAAAPERYTVNMAKARRTGRIYIDTLRNQRSATFVAPYSTRARPGAPMAVPLTWAEVEAGMRADHFTVETILRRLSTLDADPWAGMTGLSQTLP
jgi:bifunctional non-homologous end joining protein LigD